MPRTKGSKNRISVSKDVDYAALIVAKQVAKESGMQEIESITAQIKTLQADLKAQKAAVKKLDKDIVKLKAKKVAAEEKAAAEAKKTEAENVVKKLLAEGMTADEIIEALK